VRILLSGFQAILWICKAFDIIDVLIFKAGNMETNLQRDNELFYISYRDFAEIFRRRNAIAKKTAVVKRSYENVAFRRTLVILRSYDNRNFFNVARTSPNER
jgi:hypothetical protein